MDMEKIIMCDDNRCKGDNDSALWAMMNNNQQWNNPMMYLVWMMFARRAFGDENASNSAIDSLRTQMSDNQNANNLMSAINGNEGAIRELAGTLNCDFNALSGAICDVRSAIQKVAGEVGFSAERVINAANLGDCRIIEALNSCCCSTQKEIIKMGYENQLANERQTNFLQSKMDGLGNAITQGFASVGFETQKQTCDILNNANGNTQRIIDTLNQHWNQELQMKYQDAKAELSQIAQTNALSAQLTAMATAIAKIPTT